MATADHRAVYKQLPVTEGRQKLAVVALLDARTGNMRGLLPQAQLFGVTAAFLRYVTASRMLAAMAAKRLRILCWSCFENFGVVAKRDCM